jgi:hypothetical protein
MVQERYYGWVDVMNGTMLPGWAVDRLSSGPCSIDVYVNSVHCAQGWADQYRPDLPSEIANSGFAIDLANLYHEGDKIEVHFGGTNVSPSGGPRYG